uniref:Uncharacterized protein n=1 Tax=Leersia perrieri TaxID=77586 RepID=A0A0D9VG06_9ORYZ
MSCESLQLWERKVSSEVDAEWVLRKTDDLNRVLGVGSGMEIRHLIRLGYAEDSKTMFLYSDSTVIMLSLDSLRSKKLWETNVVTPLPYSTHIAGMFQVATLYHTLESTCSHI